MWCAHLVAPSVSSSGSVDGKEASHGKGRSRTAKRPRTAKALCRTAKNAHGTCVIRISGRDALEPQTPIHVAAVSSLVSTAPSRPSTEPARRLAHRHTRPPCPAPPPPATSHAGRHHPRRTRRRHHHADASPRSHHHRPQRRRAAAAPGPPLASCCCSRRRAIPAPCPCRPLLHPSGAPISSTRAAPSSPPPNQVDRNGDGQKRQTTIAKNILRYLPVLPRIQRLFMTEDTAQQMRWAVEGNRYTDKMIHPSDGSAWKNFVKKFPLKAGDPRSVAVAISTDGFNPYGPKYPGKNMNVYLEPLVDDLVRGWEGRGIRTYDASKKEYFDMYVWYHTSLHDLPARALFCGWCTHGKWPCPQCRQAVTFFWLNKGGKYSCFDEARQFLERRHAYMSDVKSFKKGRVVRGPKPILKTGMEIKAELDALQPSPDGNGFLGYGETHQWTHKPCLWKLPYFEFLELPHNIDVMHTEKNISEAIWSTIVDTEKTKDNIKARIDQEMWCDRPELNMQPPHGAKKTWTKPHAPFCLTKAQKREVFQWMKDSLFFPEC
ncbi:hypothetical protein QYE76_025657 [Lolium multiflorum]|uniref:Uncharacterized protein n=1 Tax=Lolium multiflorum TaxID=4521 RepID=A0AAD8RFZ9_LOLMU|nr:hypothetical protein QYE76_025657 [Lolium multiflorum]